MGWALFFVTKIQENLSGQKLNFLRTEHPVIDPEIVEAANEIQIERVRAGDLKPVALTSEGAHIRKNRLIGNRVRCLSLRNSVEEQFDHAFAVARDRVMV